MNVNLYKLIEKKFKQNIEDETTLNLALDVLNQRENLTQENQKYKETINKAKKWVKNRINHCTIEANSTTTDTMCRITIVGLNNLLDILKENFITISKRQNEIQLINNDKENISEVLIFALQSWVQFIHYLNNEENIYLAELRDKLLPDLMSGKINLERDVKDE